MPTPQLMYLNISVIIPVYNAALYLEKAVLSALRQSSVKEIILVEDGSSDTSYTVCQQLATKYDLIQLFTHPGRVNRGPGASRNVGLRNATMPLVAFLDADDFYLENRFVNALDILKKEPEVDGVFEAIGTHFYDKLKQSLFASELTTMHDLDLGKSSLFKHLVSGQYGYFSLDGLVFRKKILANVGLFNEALRQGEDTDYIWRLALNQNLWPGTLDKAVAKRGVHTYNGIFNQQEVSLYRKQLHNKWFLLMLQSNWSRQVNWAFTRKKLESKAYQLVGAKSRSVIRVVKLLLLPVLCIRYPRVIYKLVIG